MFRKTLVALMMFGTSTAALAHGAPARDARTTEIVRAPIHKEIVRPKPVRTTIVREPVRTEIIRDRHEARPNVRPIVRDRFYIAPTYVYQPTPVYEAPIAVSPLASGQMFLSLDGAAGNGIELVSSGGSTFVSQALIQYADGHSQTVEIRQYLDANNPSLQIASDTCPIAGVTIFGQGAGVSAMVV